MKFFLISESSHLGMTKSCARLRRLCEWVLTGGSSWCSTWSSLCMMELNNCASAASHICKNVWKFCGRKPDLCNFFSTPCRRALSSQLIKPAHADFSADEILEHPSRLWIPGRLGGLPSRLDLPPAGRDFSADRTFQQSWTSQPARTSRLVI